MSLILVFILSILMVVGCLPYTLINVLYWEVACGMGWTRLWSTERTCLSTGVRDPCIALRRQSAEARWIRQAASTCSWRQDVSVRGRRRCLEPMIACLKSLDMDTGPMPNYCALTLYMGLLDFEDCVLGQMASQCYLYVWLEQLCSSAGLVSYRRLGPSLAFEGILSTFLPHSGMEPTNNHAERECVPSSCAARSAAR